MMKYISNKIIEFKMWRNRKYWKKKHLDFIRSKIIEDDRYLANDPIASEIFKRYKLIVSEHYNTIQHESSIEFRRRLKKQIPYFGG